MIPIFDLKKQYKTLEKELNTAFVQTAANGYFTLGDNVSSFEREFANDTGLRYGVGLASGTDALTLGLKALGIKQTDEVILPANSYPSAFGVALSGARIKLVDVQDDGTMDPKALADTVTRKTRAVIPVHLYGNPADIYAIRNVIPKSVYIVEDAAQAHGTHIGQKKAGSLGDIGCFSFYPSKNLGALGDGGMVVTNDTTVATRIQRLRMYGEHTRYRSKEVSGVSRLDELQAAFLRVKLRHLDAWVTRRREIAKRYISGLADVRGIRCVTHNMSGSFHLFVIRTPARNRLKTYLTKHGIGTAVHYPIPIHLVPSFRYLGYRNGDFPMSESLCRTMLSIPIFPELTNQEVDRVIETIQHYFRIYTPSGRSV